jgi:CRISPR/Cas system endoribonuclease Cas6 (RAMP superfamily)
MKSSKKGNSRSILYPSVEKILIKLLGENWYENENKEEKQLERAKQYQLFYEEHERIPSLVLQGKNKINLENQLFEHRLAEWYGTMKGSKKKQNRSILYPRVEKIFIELLGEKWFENKNMEERSLIQAKEFKKFHEEHNRKPSKVLDGKSNKTHQINEHQKK